MNRKLKQVTLTYENEDGTVVKESLEDEQAEKWNEFGKSVSMIAHIHGMNPDWSVLKWDICEVPKAKTEPSISRDCHVILDATKTLTAYQIADRLGTVMYIIYGDTALERLADLIYRKQPEEVTDKESLIYLLEYLRETEEYENELKRNSKK